MSVTWLWCGALRHDSVWVRGQVSGSSVRMAVADNEELSGPVFYGPASPDGTTGVASIVADELEPDTEYFFAFEIDSTLDLDWGGSFRTLPTPGAAGTIEFWSASCAGSGSSDWLTSRVSNRPTFETIANRRYRFGIHTGDLHYRDIGSGTHVSPPFNAAKYRQAYHDVLTFNGTLGPAARQGILYRTTPIAYIWDDHDYGPNDSDGTLAHKAEAGLAYRQCVPHYPLPDSGGAIYQTFVAGQTRFILWDVRFHRSANSAPDGPSKTMLGSAQKQWTHDVLTSATEEFLVVAKGSQWSRTTGSDNWSNFSHERNELVDMFHDLGWADRMMMLQGDNHAAGINTGAGVPGGWPLMMFAPLDSNPASPSNSLWDVGVAGGNRGQWGSVRIEAS